MFEACHTVLAVARLQENGPRLDDYIKIKYMNIPTQNAMDNAPIKYQVIRIALSWSSSHKCGCVIIQPPRLSPDATPWKHSLTIG